MRLGKRCSRPSKMPTMSKRHSPPSRISALWFSMLRPAGPYHCASASGSIQAAKTLLRGCFSTLTSTISRSSDQVSNSFSIVILCRLVQISFQPVETLGPASALRFHPVCRLGEARPLQPAPAAAPSLLAGDQSAILQHLKMLGEGGQRHVERLG